MQEWLKSNYHFLDSSIWSPRSPDFNPCDFSLWGRIKATLYNPKPNTVYELKENIIREFNLFKKSDLKSNFLNLEKRLDLVKQQNGKHIEHLLK